MKCHKCEYDYPDDLVRAMILHDGTIAIVIHVCGICALESKNRVHGTNDDHFDAPEAERVRLAAIEYRKKVN